MKNKLNKSPEPAPGFVTSRAGARAAPIPVVAHLDVRQKMQPWIGGKPRCASCGTRRHPRSWKGLCVRCYPLVAKIEKIDCGLYRRRGRGAGVREDENACIRRCAVRELADFMALEAPLLGQTTGDDIEGLFVAISEVTGATTNRIDGVRYIFEACVEPKKLNSVYEALLRIVESVPSKWARRQNARRPFWHRPEEEK